MRNFVVAILVAGMATTAFAAKAHRTAKKDISPKIKESAKAIKADCGAAPKVLVDWKAFNKVPADKVRDYKSNIERELGYVADMSKKFCSDDESKALFKQNVKAIVISVAKEGDPETTYKKGKFVIKTTKQMNSGGYAFENKMNEW